MNLNYDVLYCIAEYCDFSTRLALEEVYGCSFKPNRLCESRLTLKIPKVEEQLDGSACILKLDFNGAPGTRKAWFHHEKKIFVKYDDHKICVLYSFGRIKPGNYEWSSRKGRWQIWCAD